MFLALSILLFLSPSFVPVAECESVKGGFNLSNFGNTSFAYHDIIFSPFASPVSIPKLYLLQAGFPSLISSTPNKDAVEDSKNVTSNSARSELSKRNAPARVPRVRPSKDYGKSSHYRMKEYKDSTRKGFYLSLLQKLLRPKSSRTGKNYSSGYSSKYSSPKQDWYVSSAPMESAPSSGWGWGGGKGHGVSLLDLLLCGLSLLSLGGFLLNLLLNLLNMFGAGMFTTTSTYPVTVTSTQTATGTGTGGGVTTTGTGGTTAVTLPTQVASGLSSGWDITGRTIDSIAGWGWKGNQAFLKGRLKFKGGWWPSSTTTTPPPTVTGPTYPVDPTLTGTGGTAKVASLFASGRKKRHKREEFQPYVNPSTSLNIFAKGVLNSMNAATTNQYICIEKIFCENNKQARVIGQWLDYFMPVYSFSLSYFGYRAGVHESLFDHIRAIVLGLAETNCQTQAHFPRCGEPTDP